MRFNSWLIDTDQDELGFQVITDLHGGDPQNPHANQEFREIKENVQREVGGHIEPLQPLLKFAEAIAWSLLYYGLEEIQAAHSTSNVIAGIRTVGKKDKLCHISTDGSVY